MKREKRALSSFNLNPGFSELAPLHLVERHSIATAHISTGSDCAAQQQRERQRRGTCGELAGWLLTLCSLTAPKNYSLEVSLRADEQALARARVDTGGDTRDDVEGFEGTAAQSTARARYAAESHACREWAGGVRGPRATAVNETTHNKRDV